MDAILKSIFIDHLEQHLRVFEGMRSCVSNDLVKLSKMIASSLREGNKIIIAGNGGSAADAQHIAAEFLVKLQDRRKALSAIAITTDTSVLTATANDFDFDYIFARQIEGIGKQGDIFLGLTTSGKSKNIERALKSAKELGMTNVVFTGDSTCCFKHIDYQLNVPSKNVARIQEAHIFLGHLLVLYIERQLNLC